MAVTYRSGFDCQFFFFTQREKISELRTESLSESLPASFGLSIADGGLGLRTGDGRDAAFFSGVLLVGEMTVQSVSARSLVG